MARAKARHILIKNKDICEDIKKDIENGKNFSTQAAEFSECPSGKDGGDLGYFSHGQMVPEFDTVVFSAEVGKVYGPVKTDFGYHLIIVDSLEA